MSERPQLGRSGRVLWTVHRPRSWSFGTGSTEGWSPGRHAFCRVHHFSDARAGPPTTPGTSAI